MNTIKTYHSASSADYITPCEENDFDISLIEQLASSSLTSLKESYAGLGEKVYTLAERVIDLKKSEYNL